MKDMISVVVPVYNMGDSLEKCVNSILAQEEAEFEVILVDDGSTDDSWQRCEKLMARDERVQAYHTENRGSGPARNYGMDKARGRYVYFPDADDTLVPLALKTMLASVQKNGADVLVFGYQVLDENGQVRRKKTYPDFYRDGDQVRMDYGDYAGLKTKFGIQGAPWNKMFDLQVIRQHGISYPPLRRHQDEGFIARYMAHAGRVQFIQDVLYTHYQNTLDKEWRKFPVDYADIVMQLYQLRKETILSWNPADKRTSQIITEEYVDNFIKAMELSFSPKHEFSARQRLKWVTEKVEQAGICKFEIFSDYSAYKKVVLHLLKRNAVGPALMVMRLKIFADSHGLDGMSKKYRG